MSRLDAGCEPSASDRTTEVVGTTTGLAVAAGLDWSDDSSGLFAVGAGLVVIGNLVVTGLLSLLITSWKPDTSHSRPR